MFILVMLCSLNLSAQEPPAQKNTLADKFHRGISGGIDKTFSWMDSFFIDQSRPLLENTSAMHLSFGTFVQEGKETENVSRVRLRARLPHLEDRLQIFVLGETEDINTTDSEWESAEQEYSAGQDDKLTVGVAFHYDEIDRHDLGISSGLRVTDGEADFYLRPNYQYNRVMGLWNMQVKTRITWYDRAGLESSLLWRWQRPLSESTRFRVETLVDWFDDEEGLFPRLNLSWQKKIDQRRLLSLSWNNYFVTEPADELDTAILGVNYRQQFWRPWFWLEVSPQLAYPREDDYRDVPGLLLQMHAYF